MDSIYSNRKNYGDGNPYYWMPGSIGNLPPYFHYPPNIPIPPQPNIFNNFSSGVKIEAPFVKVEEFAQENSNGLEVTKKTKKFRQKLPKFQGEHGQQDCNEQFNYDKPSVTHSATYFDPSAAPMITSLGYNKVEDDLKDTEAFSKMSQKNSNELNQLEFREQDQNPFIQYRFRRIKKKYKKYLALRHPDYYHWNQNLDDDSEKGENGELQDNSESSDSARDEESNSKNAFQCQKKMGRKMKKSKGKQKKRKRTRNFTIENVVSINMSYRIKK